MTASTAPLSAAGRELPKRWLAIIATIWGGQAASMITSYAAIIPTPNAASTTDAM